MTVVKACDLQVLPEGEYALEDANHPGEPLECVMDVYNIQLDERRSRRMRFMGLIVRPSPVHMAPLGVCDYYHRDDGCLVVKTWRVVHAREP